MRWRHGTSGVSPTLWIRSMVTPSQHMTGSLHAPPLTPEMRAYSNFLPKLWSEHLFFLCCICIFKDCMFVTVMYHWWGLLHGSWNVWFPVINCYWCEWGTWNNMDRVSNNPSLYKFCLCAFCTILIPAVSQLLTLIHHFYDDEQAHIQPDPCTCPPQHFDIKSLHSLE